MGMRYLGSASTDNVDLTRLTDSTVTVVHGSTAGTSRPSAGRVIWIGTVAPNNATTNDIWLDIS